MARPGTISNPNTTIEPGQSCMRSNHMLTSSGAYSRAISRAGILAMPLFAAYGILCVASAVIGNPSIHRDDPSVWTIERWIAWRDSQIKYILEPTLESNGEKILSREDVISRCTQAYNFIQSCLDKDPDFIMGDTARTKALGHFYDF